MDAELIRIEDGHWYIKFKENCKNIRMNKEFEYVAEQAYQKGLSDKQKKD